MDISNYLDKHENKDLLRVLTSGSVDDGKSTLIGRLLYDSKLIYDDQLAKLKDESKKSANKGDEDIDYSLLLDGLKAEREQGITIDVAYRYFSTPERKFIIADTPGHEQYTRNMATGASTAELAIILIDARKGVITQTKRHAFINSLLNLNHVVVAVNKMDLVDYDEKVFEEIKASFEDFSEELNLKNVHFLPISALKGDNVVDKSEKTNWYKGPSLLSLLETVEVSGVKNFDEFRFPVQWVNRPNLDFRGFSGTVASGVINVGDEIIALPSKKTSKVKRIVTYDGDLEQAFAPQAVTIVLEDEIDISSGEMIVKKDNEPAVSNSFSSHLVWMNESPLKVGKQYIIRHAGRTSKATISKLETRIDVNTHKREDATQLGLNEIAVVNINTTTPLFIDNYEKNRETGSFILIDPITNATSGSGMILKEHVDSNANDSVNSIVNNNIKINGEYEQKRVTITKQHGALVIVKGENKDIRKEAVEQIESSLLSKGINALSFVDENSDIDKVIEVGSIFTAAKVISITDYKDDAYAAEQIKKASDATEIITIGFGEKYIGDVNVQVKSFNDEFALEVIEELQNRRVIATL